MVRSMASTAPLPTQPRSGVAMAAKSSASPVGCSASGSVPVRPSPKSSAPSASIRERRCAQTSRRGVCSPFMTERRIRRVRAALRRPRITAAGRPSAAKVASSWENPCPGSLTAMLRTSLKRLPRRAPAACSGTFQPAACLSRRWTCALRAAVALPRAWGRCETWNILALGTTTTRCPARRLRQQKSTSSPLPGSAGSKPAEFLPDVAADQHAGGIDGKGIAAAVVLALVELVGVDQRQPLGPAARGEADVDQPPLGMPVQLLAACHRDRRRALDRVEEFGEGLGRRCGVVVQQPDPVRRCPASPSPPVRPSAGHGARALSPAMTAPPMPDLGWSKTVTLALPNACSSRAAEWSREPVSTPIDGVGGPRLGRQRRKGPGEKITAVVGDHDGGDSYFLKN